MNHLGKCANRQGRKRVKVITRETPLCGPVFDTSERRQSKGLSSRGPELDHNEDVLSSSHVCGGIPYKVLSSI